MSWRGGLGHYLLLSCIEMNETVKKKNPQLFRDIHMRILWNWHLNLQFKVLFRSVVKFKWDSIEFMWIWHICDLSVSLLSFASLSILIWTIDSWLGTYPRFTLHSFFNMTWIWCLSSSMFILTSLSYYWDQLNSSNLLMHVIAKHGFVMSGKKEWEALCKEMNLVLFSVANLNSTDAVHSWKKGFHKGYSAVPIG